MSDFLILEALKMTWNRRMCNELVWELCKEIPIVKTSDRILLTSHNIYAYLEPLFNKKLIYRDAFEFLKAKMKANKYFQIQIDEVAQNKESEPIVVINQEESDKNFTLETNHFHVGICNEINLSLPPWAILVPVGHFENVHLYYFLRLIATLIQPIRLYLEDSLDIRINFLSRFMNTQSDWIDSIELWNEHFNSEPIYGALSKYNKLKFKGSLSQVSVPKLIQWLISKNNNGQTKKYLFLGLDRLDGTLVLLKLIEEVKKEFVCATNKRRFVIRFGLNGEHLDEFTLGNELTGERLQFRHKKVKYGRYIHTLSRFPNNGLEDNENDCAELDTRGAEINLC